MTIFLTEILGSPYIGTYAFSNEKIAIVPKSVPKKKAEKIGKSLEVKVIKTDIAGSRLLGIFLAANSKGIVLPYITYEHEFETIKNALDIEIDLIQHKITALGNMILANDFGAIISPVFPEKIIQRLSDILDVEVVRGKISDLPYVGSLAVATNKGVLVHPSIQEEEERLIREVLKVDVFTGTINNGMPFIRSGLIANSVGAVVGSHTVGRELMDITRAIKV
ncbi:hypothetical protein AC481_03480 [miscellaneous Crenarchaeota group archaeon SMTZ-80]|nr:MAG: hypothetical protein AC481_03480 [miscellaneous Crenarchaeota group archaeon SMTZ-80]